MAEALALEQALAAVLREQAVSEAASPEQAPVLALQQVLEAEEQVAGVTVAALRVREPELAQPS